MNNNLLKRVGRILFTAILLLFTVAVIESSAQTPTVTVNVQNVTVKQLLQAIEENSQYKFAYPDSAFDTEKIVSVNATNRSIASIIAEVLPGFEAEVRGRQILLRKASPNQGAQQNPQKSTEIKGVIISSTDNLPIPGVAVYVKGQPTIGVAANLDGEYSLTVPSDAKTIVFESLGFDRKEIALKDTYLFRLVSLVEETNELDEVVVVGFGTQKKETLVGAIQAVKTDNLVTTSSKLTTSFAGNIAGVISRQSSGQPGYDTATYYVRGVSTFGSGTTPLIIVDGIEAEANVMNMMPPEAIESMSILKDATATALYGSRGANGVIIITTKEGHNSEKLTVNVSVENTFSMPTYVLKNAGSVSYMEAYNEATYNEAMQNGVAYTPYFTYEQIEGARKKLNPYIFPDNDWYSMLFKNFSTNQRANVNIKGGSKNVSYFLNASFYNETGIIKHPSESPLNIKDEVQTYSVQSNVTANLTKSTKLSVKLNTQIMDTTTPYEDVDDLFYYVMRCNPARFPATFPAEEGDTYVRFGSHDPWGTLYDYNPYAMLSEGYSKGFIMYMTAIVNLEQKLDFITKGLNASVIASFNNYEINKTHRTMTPYYFQVDNWWIDEDGEYQYTTKSIQDAGTTYLTSSVEHNGNHTWNFQGKINYGRVFGKHYVAADLVFHMQSEQYNGYSSNEKYILPYRQMGLAGRVTYNFGLRYFIEGDFGYNGSENFAPGKRWGFFPSVAIGWNLANEPFMSSVHDKLNTFKIRASYGQSGNDTISSNRFPYISNISMSSRAAWFGQNFGSYGAGYVSLYGNDDATWEVSNKFNVGFDLELFHSLEFSADYFYEYRYNIFMQRNSLSGTAGMDSTVPYANIGECDNRGMEMSLSYNKQFNKDWVLQLHGTFSYAHSRVLYMDEPDYADSPNLAKVGHSINSQQVLVAEGLFTSQEEIDNSPVQDFGAYTVGNIKYKDVNGDGIVNSNDYIWTDTPTLPEIMFGFGGTLRFRNWDLSLMFQGAGKSILLMSDNWAFADKVREGYGVAQWIVDNHWSYSNNVSDALYPRLSTTPCNNDTQVSTFWVHNNRYLRLKSAEIGYTYNFLRVYVQGTNLFCACPFKLWDPEKGSGNGLSYPQNRTVTIGIQFNF